MAKYRPVKRYEMALAVVLGIGVLGAAATHTPERGEFDQESYDFCMIKLASDRAFCCPHSDGDVVNDQCTDINGVVRYHVTPVIRDR